jgi:molybdopterin molybdotransferase
MPEFFNLLPPDEALAKFLAEIKSTPLPEDIPIADALDRVTFQSIRAPVSVPAFARSTMDGYAVRAQDTFGASASLPMYLALVGEVLMGRAPEIELAPGQTALIHTGGMLPRGADAVVQIEVTQKSHEHEVEILKSVAPGENVLQAGDDVQAGAEVLPAGHWLRPQDLGGLAALGLTPVTVARRPRVALLATGDEVVPPEQAPSIGQVRDVNSYAIGGLVAQAGGVPLRGGIISDSFAALKAAAQAALATADLLVLSAGSSVSVRDITVDVVAELGQPGVLVHGVSIKPGKPTLLAVANGKPIIGLPGNPVSAMVSAWLFLMPTLHRLLGCSNPPPAAVVRARLTHNLVSQAGRMDFVPVRLLWRGGERWAEPVFGKSNQIFILVQGHGLVTIPRDANGLSAGEEVEVKLFR